VPRKTIDFDAVRKLAVGLADVEDGTAYGSPALKVRGKLLACLAVHTSAERDSLVVRLGFDQRDVLVEADPDTYYLTPHYVDHPVVLVRLSLVRPDALRDLLRAAWQFVTKETPKTRKRTR
jgi:hypothetical protein